MIPKTIHYCWFSKTPDSPYPKLVKKCLDSWHNNLDGYNIKLWNYGIFPKGKSLWVDQAVESGKFAFAADYLRAYALYNEGGIYLDTDVELIKSFDAFLHLPYIFGVDYDYGYIETAVMGVEKHNPIFKCLLDYYDSKGFVNSDGTMNTTPINDLLQDIIKSNYNMQVVKSPADFDGNSANVYMLEPDYFSPIHITTMEYEPSERTVSIHHFAGSWLPASHRIKKKIQLLIGPKLTHIIQSVKKTIMRR